MPKTTFPVSAEEIRHAASLIRAGELVAFPTETVYGLGANAFDEAAVQKIFTAKGRPATSPVIVHVDSIEMAREVTTGWTEQAGLLAQQFWPGPLTLVLPKSDRIPLNVTAGLETVGVRMPDHPIALALISAAGLPIAAPSANRFTQLSPTNAEHVRKALGERVALILNGGATQRGIESTVLALTPVPRLLRPGGVSRSAIESVVGRLSEDAGLPHGAHPSPGLHAKHYSPRTPVLLVKDADALPRGRGVYLSFRNADTGLQRIQMPETADAYAAVLYATLHELDEQGWEWIAIEEPPQETEWEAVRDRLQRAAAQPR